MWRCERQQSTPSQICPPVDFRLRVFSLPGGDYARLMTSFVPPLGVRAAGAGTSGLQMEDEEGEEPSRDEEGEGEGTGGYSGGAAAVIFSSEAAVSVSVAGGMYAAEEGAEEDADVDEHHFTGAKAATATPLCNRKGSRRNKPTKQQ